ncbi:MAG: hypothetical protein CVT71_01665, partial [Alphaproteobacteria bacterium HGW-Alphaproteobacteria-10]
MRETCRPERPRRRSGIWRVIGGGLVECGKRHPARRRRHRKRLDKAAASGMTGARRGGAPGGADRMTTQPQQVMRGIALMLGAFVCFTAIDTCAKWLVLSGMPTGQVAFVRFLGHLVAVSALFLPRTGLRLFATGALPLQLARGGFLLAGTLLNFFAVRHLPLTVTSSIFFTMPLMVCALSIPLLGEKV